MDKELYALLPECENEIISPSLIYYPDIIKSNTELTIKMAHSASRLWPHVKTHKMAEMIKMQISMGITRFKCATISELEMVCSCGAEHALLSYPLVGPNVKRFLDLVSAYPSTEIYALEDSFTGLEMLSVECAKRNVNAKWFCDVNLGMDRTGVKTENIPAFISDAIRNYPNLIFSGLHCYDGQNHQSDVNERTEAINSQLAVLKTSMKELEEIGAGSYMVIIGGSPTFPMLSEEDNVFLSPGTVFVWDYGYMTSYSDMGFVPAAAILTRVVSHPADGVFTLDCGYKAIASDPSGLRGCLLDCHASPLFQSEEHWTWKMDEGFESSRPNIGDVMYIIPTHICPTTALYPSVITASNGTPTGSWPVTARNRVISF